MTKNVVLNIMLRCIGRIWECKVTCDLHGCAASASELDDKEVVLRQALEKLPCDCYQMGKDQ